MLIVALASPLLFTSATFAPDWLLHLVFIWHQSTTIQDNHFPSLFYNYFHQVFYPQYAFYGGTLYALAGILSAILGGAPLATYVLTYCLGFVAAYGGWYWLARIAGIGRWRSHVPGLVFVTSASYLTMLYGRGDWPEFIAISVIPLMCAAGLSVLRSKRASFWPALALAVACVVFFGSHNMTLLWGSTFLTAVGAAILLCVPQARHELTRRRVLRVASLVVPALLVSAWFLLPTIAYASRTWAGSGYGEGVKFWKEWLRYSIPWVPARHLFALSRTDSKPGSGLIFTLPVLVIAWIVAGAGVLWRAGTPAMWRRMLVILCGAALLAGLLMTHAGLIELLPHPYFILVYTYRLDSYVLLGICGALLAVLALAQQAHARRVRLWMWTLLPVLLVSLLGAAQQLKEVRTTGGNRTAVLSSYLSPQLPGQARPLLLEDYANILPAMQPTTLSARIVFPPASVQDDRASVTAHFYPGERVDSNIGGGPELVHVSGARIVGRSREGSDVLEITGQPAGASAGSPAPTETIAVSPASSWPLVLGRVLSLLGIALLAARLLIVARARRARS